MFDPRTRLSQIIAPSQPQSCGSPDVSIEFQVELLVKLNVYGIHTKKLFSLLTQVKERATILPHAIKTQVQTLNHHSINVSSCFFG